MRSTEDAFILEASEGDYDISCEFNMFASECSSVVEANGPRELADLGTAENIGSVSQRLQALEAVSRANLSLRDDFLRSLADVEERIMQRFRIETSQIHATFEKNGDQLEQLQPPPQSRDFASKRDFEHIQHQLDELKRKLCKVGHSEYPAETDIQGKMDSLLVETAPSKSSEVPEQLPQEDIHLLTKERLSSCNMYQFHESVWDAATFVGCGCIGRDVSILTVLALLLNICIQLAFTERVLDTLVINPLSQQELTSLLDYRVSVAHDVTNADPLSRRSMVRQLCDEDHGLHLAGSQMNFFSDMKDFWENALLLCVLAQVIWVATILREVNLVYNYSCSILSVPIGDVTDIVVEDESGQDGAATSSAHDPNRNSSVNDMVSLVVVAKIRQITCRRRAFVFAFIVFPRLLIAFFLGYSGVRYLGYTTNSGDLILNAMALAFVIDIDDLTYPLFIPRRMQTLVANLQPLPIKRDYIQKKLGWTWQASYHVATKYVIFSVIMVLILLRIIEPFFGTLELAMNILCSGNKDFVFAKNAATGMLDIAVSPMDEPDMSEWLLGKLTILQAIQPNLSDGLIKHTDWAVPARVLEAASSSVNLAVLPMLKTSLAQVSYTPFHFDLVKTTSGASVHDAAHDLTCTDGSDMTEVASRTFLQEFLGNNTINGCDANNTWLEAQCAKKGNTNLRAICPQLCHCDQQQAINLGFFGGKEWGCPNTCSVLMTAVSKFWLVQGYYDDCDDVHDTTFAENADGKVLNYFHGLLEYASGRASWVRYVSEELVPTLSESVFGIPRDKQDEFQQDTVKMAIIERMAESKWELVDGYPLVDAYGANLTGCQFWTSWKMTLLLSMDLCSVGRFRSIRFLCPEACGCSKENYQECPLSCTYAEDELPTKEGDFDHVKENGFRSSQIYQVPGGKNEHETGGQFAATGQHATPDNQTLASGPGNGQNSNATNSNASGESEGAGGSEANNTSTATKGQGTATPGTSDVAPALGPTYGSPTPHDANSTA